MTYVLVALTILILAGVLLSCAVLGSDRFSTIERLGVDGIEVLGPDRRPGHPATRRPRADGTVPATGPAGREPADRASTDRASTDRGVEERGQGF